MAGDIELKSEDGIVNFYSFIIDFSTITLIEKKRWFGDFTIKIHYVPGHYELMNFGKKLDKRNEIFELIRNHPNCGERIMNKKILWNDCYNLDGEYQGD
jgi:hypothetical protein